MSKGLQWTLPAVGGGCQTAPSRENEELRPGSLLRPEWLIAIALKCEFKVGAGRG